MRINDLWFYVAGLAMGVALAATVALWTQASATYRIVFVVLLVSLSLATWSKRKPYEGDSSTDGKALHALIGEGSPENDTSANTRDNQADNPRFRHSEPPMRNVP